MTPEKPGTRWAMAIRLTSAGTTGGNSESRRFEMCSASANLR